MSIVLGFGSTEKEQIRNEYEVITEIVHKAFKENPHESEYLQDGFGEKFVEVLKTELEERYKILLDADDLYSKSNYKDAPERYYFCYYSVCGDVNNLFVGVKFMQVNTKHGMSPDGIAMLQQEEVFWYKSSDVRRQLLNSKEASTKGGER